MNKFKGLSKGATLKDLKEILIELGYDISDENWQVFFNSISDSDKILLETIKRGYPDLYKKILTSTGFFESGD